MATKKPVTKDEEQLQELQAAEEPAQEQTGVDPWDETITMVVPRKGKGEDQQYYVCVNDRRYMVPASGKMETLPKPVALILQDAIEAEYEADDFADHIPNRSGENPQMHGI